MRILIVEDEPLIGRMMRRALSDHEVDVAESAAEGLALHVAEPYALAFVDVGLPDSLGSDLGRALECATPLRVVLIGGGDLSLFRAFGTEVLQKPFTFDQIRAYVASDDSSRDLPDGGI